MWLRAHSSYFVFAVAVVATVVSLRWDNVGPLVAAAFVVFALHAYHRSRTHHGETAPPASPAGSAVGEALAGTARSLSTGHDTYFQEIEAEIAEEMRALTHPEQFLTQARFRRTIDLLRDDPSVSDAALLGRLQYLTHFVDVLAVAALLQRTGAQYEGQVLRSLGEAWPWGRYALLRALDEVHPPPEPRVLYTLSQLDESWLESENAKLLRAWVRRRFEAGEVVPDAKDLAHWWTKELDDRSRIAVRRFLLSIGPGLATPWAVKVDVLDEMLDDEEPSSARGRSAGRSSAAAELPEDLSSLGRWWLPPEESGGLVPPFRTTAALTSEQRRCRVALAERVGDEEGRPLVVVGHARSGKSTVIRDLVLELLRGGWQVFEASADQVNADAKYVGELEGRAQALVNAFGAPPPRRIWFLTELSALFHVGPVSGDLDRTLARMLRPALEDGRLRVVAECSSDEWQRLRTTEPWVVDAFDVVELDVPSVEDTFALAREIFRGADGRALVDEGLLRCAWDLVRQFLDETRRPGNLVDLLRVPLERANAHRAADAVRPIGREQLLESMAVRTGLPLELLDERRPLDLQAVAAHFRRRVQGQDDAVNCLVDRLAMIKTGVTDPTRPLGVLLFAGPTGTGKTELAKALATWLFGSEQRLIRVDMSELKHPLALEKLIGSPSSTLRGGHSLVERVRAQPHSVVLLDEFEKSHPEIWDLFLQMFDDGRLSDGQGRTVDFRQTMILVTTNLGSAINARAKVGFRTDPRQFRAEDVLEALRETVQPELLNRFDRVVVFHPLSRDLMRTILVGQIERTIARRGLRDRPWAMEWSDDAIEFLLDRGFTDDLGARPLQRALDQYVLAPLARTIATQQAPEGDQFLFVRRDGDGLSMDFVDPDAEDGPPVVEPAGHGVAAIALDGTGHAKELVDVDLALGSLESALASEPAVAEREALLARMAEPGFWDDDARFAVLERFETLDRITRAVQSARSLHERLTGGHRERTAADAIRRLARKVHVLEHALADHREGRGTEVLIAVRRHGAAVGSRAQADAFGLRIAAMYRGWAEATGAKVEEVGAGWPADARPLWAARVSGFGVAALLGPEAGLHVHEEPSHEENRLQRQVVRVDVVDVGIEGGPDEASARAHDRLLHAADSNEAVPVVRRYREGPNPLVRDAIRTWRTGRIDRVLEGCFDLMGPSDDPARAAASV